MHLSIKRIAQLENAYLEPMNELITEAQLVSVNSLLPVNDIVGPRHGVDIQNDSQIDNTKDITALALVKCGGNSPLPLDRSPQTCTTCSSISHDFNTAQDNFGQKSSPRPEEIFTYSVRLFTLLYRS